LVKAKEQKDFDEK